MSSSSALNTLLGSSTSSGIDISSLLQAALGASSSGIDVTGAVNAAISAARAPESAWHNEQTTLQSQMTALNQLQSESTNLQNDLLSLNDLGGPLAARTLTSSNTNIVSGSVAPGSTIGNHTIVVNALATTTAWASTSVASAATTLGSGSFTITSAGGKTTTVPTNDSTLTQLASQINTDSLGITASVITDSNGSRLALASSTSGTAADFTISAPTSASVQFSRASTGADASLKVDGIQIDSASNSVAGVLPGITLNLLNVAPGTNVSLSVSPDASQASAAVNQFVSDFNAILKDLNTQFTFSGSSQGPLAGDSAVRTLQSDLLGALSYQAPASGSTAVSSLASLGISVGNDGTLTVDNSTLTNAVQSNFAGVQTFFQGTAINGFAQSLQTQMGSFLSPSHGAFTVDLKSLDTQYSDLQNSINSFEANYIVPLHTQLQSEYSQAEILLQELPHQLDQINTMLGQNTKSS